MNDAAQIFDQEEFSDRVMGSDALARRILRSFVDDMPRQLALLAEALSDGDSARVRTTAHGIKGAAANVSGNEIRQASWKLEQQAHEGNLSGADATLLEISASFERAKPAMVRYCEEDD